MNKNNPYHGSLFGVAIGDAIGLPFEMHTHRQIIGVLDAEYLGDHDGLVHRYYPIGRHGMYRRAIPSSAFPDLNYSSTGICSDDTLLTLAIADSIRDNEGINLDDMVARHVRAVQEEPFGFGKGTGTTMKNIGAGMDWRNVRDTSFGNGIMMKQMPFAFHEAIQGEASSSALIRLSQITHGHPSSLVATRVHHRLLIDIILTENTTFDMSYWLQRGVSFAQACENEYGAENQISLMMQDIVNERDKDMSLSEIGRRYARKFLDEKNAYFNILSTLGICYALFLRKQNFTVVQQGVSVGGDTDSYASILGSMVGALHGDIFEKKYKDDLHPRYKDKLIKTLSL